MGHLGGGGQPPHPSYTKYIKKHPYSEMPLRRDDNARTWHRNTLKCENNDIKVYFISHWTDEKSGNPGKVGKMASLLIAVADPGI